jgi:hypothetical protein
MSFQNTSSHVLLALERPTRIWKEDVPSRAGELIQACIFRLRGTCSGDLGPGTTYSFCSLAFRRSSLAFSVREARNRPSGCVKFHIRDSEPLTRLPGETRLVSERTWDERECSLQAKLFPRKHPKAWTGNPNLNFYEAGCSATAGHEMSP